MHYAYHTAIWTPFGISQRHFHKACSFFTIACNLIPIWGPSRTRYSLWPHVLLPSCFLGIEEWEGSCGATLNWDVHGMECWHERTLLENVFCNTNSTRQLLHFVSPWTCFSGLVSCTGHQKAKRVGSQWLQEKNSCCTFQVVVYMFFFPLELTSSGNSCWDPGKQKLA